MADWGNVKTDLITLGPGIYGGWSNPLTTDLITFVEGIYGGWSDPLATVELTLKPSDIIYGGWKRVSSADITLSLGGGQPCSVDDDCPEGYLCVNGECVREGREGSPVPWIIAGAASLAAVGALIVAKKPKEKGR